MSHQARDWTIVATGLMLLFLGAILVGGGCSDLMPTHPASGSDGPTTPELTIVLPEVRSGAIGGLGALATRVPWSELDGHPVDTIGGPFHATPSGAEAVLSLDAGWWRIHVLLGGLGCACDTVPIAVDTTVSMQCPEAAR